MRSLAIALFLVGCVATDKRPPEIQPILTKPRISTSDPVLVCRRYPGRVLECARVEREEVMRVLRDIMSEGNLK